MQHNDAADGSAVRSPLMKNSIKIATVYRSDFYHHFCLDKMSEIRWIRISQALANRGYQVDVIMNAAHGLIHTSPNLRYVPYSKVNWQDYDIIKTLFHKGFESLRSRGGEDHPFIISKLGSVV